MKRSLRSLFAAAALAAALPLSAAPKPPAPACVAALERATTLAKDKEKQATAAVAAFAEAIAADPDHLRAHEALQRFREDLRLAAYRNKELQPAVDAVNKAVEEHYAVWERQFPDSIGLQFAVAARLYGEEDPRAKTYLLKVVAHDPGFARAWYMLSFDAERWGDEKGGSDYMLKASQADPTNPDYAFYYASGLDAVAPERWEAASRDVARRFPASERGAQALYWLGQKSHDDAKRIAVWEQARKDFPPEKFNWTQSSMSGLFDAYLRTAPAKAVALARELAAAGGEGAKAWSAKADFAQATQEVRALVAAGKFAEASAQLDQLTVDRRSSNPVQTLLLKAEVGAGAGNVPAAYDLLLARYAQTAEDGLRMPLAGYGAKLGKSAAQVEADLWAKRDAAAKPAPAFDLGLYTSDQTLSLASLRGKVVFLTFWFPGCGPCRAEFPHFENVMARFRGKDVVYLGINGIRNQDDYVLPFMAGTKYSFVPLKGDKDVISPQAYAVRGYPANFLIDRDGRIVYSNFRAHDPQSELSLQRMIESLLERPASLPAASAQ